MRAVSHTHRTAIRRSKVSAPTKWLKNKELIIGRWLDYGCGYGYDADHLEGCKYDPHYFPTLPIGKFDTIICNYVLNVIPEEGRQEVVEHIYNLLKKGGKAYISVRRDIDKPTTTMKNTFQDRVVLNLPSLFHKKRGFEIYMLEG